MTKFYGETVLKIAEQARPDDDDFKILVSVTIIT